MITTSEKRDWNGNSKAVFVTNGDSSHSKDERANLDYYATDPKAAKMLLELEDFAPRIWECACGEGHLAKVFKEAGYDVLATDLIDRGYGVGGIDFLKCENQFEGSIITNPPYCKAKEFVEHALELVPDGYKVAMFLKLQFLEGQARRELFKKYPPKTVYVSSSRLLCGKNGEFNKGNSSAVAYCWYVWERGYDGKTVIKWFN